MKTVEYSELIVRIAEITHLARDGHSTLVCRGGVPSFLIGHPDLLEESSRCECGWVAASDFYARAKRICERMLRENQSLILTCHGRPWCCLIPAALFEDCSVYRLMHSKPIRGRSGWLEVINFPSRLRRSRQENAGEGG